MSTPTITSLDPSAGPTGGLTLVEVQGSGFRLPLAPPASGPTTFLRPSVEVLVGGRAAANVRVRAADRLSFLAPAHDAGAADVVVRNLDDAGVPIPGEEAVLAAGFTYARPRLTVESDLTRLVRMLLRELKRQVIENVVLTVQTDFDATTGDELHLAELASLPALVLVGPELVEDRFYSLNQMPEAAAGPGLFARRRVPYTVDLGFTLVGASDHTIELLNLTAATELFFHRNKFVELDRDPASPALGSVRYEMDLAPGGDLKATSQPNESNVRSFSGAFVIRGFDLEDLAGVPDDTVVERGAPVAEVVLEPTQQTGTRLPVGRNPDP